MHFKQIVLNEIACEGLEGITLDCLWIHLKAFTVLDQIDDQFKEYIWSLVRSCEEINFYRLPEPRNSNFTPHDRMDYYLYDQDCFLEADTPCQQLYHLAPVIGEEDVHGSCETYRTRKRIDKEIRQMDLSYSMVHQTYGDALVIVATEAYRRHFLGITHETGVIGDKVYACLEVIARSRHNGIKCVGKHSLLQFIGNAQILWYAKRKLRASHLIRIQKTNMISPNKTVNEVVIIHLNRFYRPFYNVFEQLLEKFLLHLSVNHSRCQLKATFNTVLGLNDQFLLRAKRLHWLDTVSTSYRRLVATDMDDSVTASTKELLGKYQEDFMVPDATSDAVDKCSLFVIAVKDVAQALEDLAQHCMKLTAAREDDTDPHPDILLSTDRISLVLDEAFEEQILDVLGKQKMSLTELRTVFNLPRRLLQSLLNSMIKNKQLEVTFRSVQRHSIPYYSIIVPTVVDNSSEAMAEVPSNNLSKMQVVANRARSPTSAAEWLSTPMKKRQDRMEFLCDLVAKKTVIEGTAIAIRIMREWEAGRGLLGMMDRKSFRRILAEAVEAGRVQTMEVELSLTSNRKQTQEWLVAPGTLRTHKAFTDKYALCSGDVEVGNNNMHRVNNMIHSAHKPKKKKICTTFDVLMVGKVFSVANNESLVDCKIPELPLMIRRKLFHEFIWYLSVGICLEDDDNKIIERIKCLQTDDYGFTVHQDVDSWRRYIWPLSNDCNSVRADEVFTINDLLLRMPLIVYCLLFLPHEAPPALGECLDNQLLRWMPLAHLRAVNERLLAFLVQPKIGRKVIDMVESLLNMGLVRKVDTGTIYKHKEAVFALNKEVFLTDTTQLRLPESSETMWSRCPRFCWLLDSKVALVSYWANVYCVSTNGKCDKVGDSQNKLRIIKSNNDNVAYRDDSYIAELVTGFGQLDLASSSKVRQFGAWLPQDSMRWKDLGSCGFHGCVQVSGMLSWCINKYDRACADLEDWNMKYLMERFRTSLFSSFDDHANTITTIPSLNETLSTMLREVNVFYTSVIVLGFENDLSKLWKIVHKKKWFRKLLSHIPIGTQNVIDYVPYLTTEHEFERKKLVELATERINKHMAGKEGPVTDPVIVRMVMQEIMRIHRYVPQMNTFATDFMSGTVPLETIMKMQGGSSDGGKKETRGSMMDDVSSMEKVVSLSLAKYVMGCMRTSEATRTETEEVVRNDVFRKYHRVGLFMDVFNGFRCLPVKNWEPMKPDLCFVEDQTAKDGYRIHRTVIEERLRKLGEKLVSKLQTAVPDYKAYVAAVPAPDKSGMTTVCMRPVEGINEANLLTLSCLLLAQLQHRSPQNEMRTEIGNGAMCLSERDIQQPGGSRCKAKLYKVNWHKQSVSKLSWIKVMADCEVKVSLSTDSYDVMCGRDIGKDKLSLWTAFNKTVHIDKGTDHVPIKRVRTRSQTVTTTNEADAVLRYVDDGGWAGKTYSDVQMMADMAQSSSRIDDLLETGQVHMVGFNTVRLVSNCNVRPWTIKLVVSHNQQQSLTSPSPKDKQKINNRKRNAHDKSDNHSTTEYFIPELWRDANGFFKPIVFRNIINRLFAAILRNTVMPLSAIIADLSWIIGSTAVRQAINIMFQYGVVDVRTVSGCSKQGLFQHKRPLYQPAKPDVFHDDPDCTTIILHPQCHFRMSRLVTDMDRYCSNDIDIEMPDK